MKVFEKKTGTMAVLLLLLIGMVLVSNEPTIKASGTIYITADGSITSPTAPIHGNGDTYGLPGSIAATDVAAASLLIADSAMAEGVNSTTYQPINRTEVFTAADTYAYSWIKLADVPSPSHNVTWIWLTPNYNIYFRFSGTIPDPGQGSVYPQYYVDCCIYVKGSSALFTPGQWHVDVYIDGAIALVQNFTLLSQYLTPEGIRSAYDVLPLIQCGYTGKNVTVAVINTGIDSTFYDDIRGFDTAFGLPNASISVVTPFGTQGTDVESPTGETTGDVEFVHAMAPDAHILLVLVGKFSSLLEGFSYVIDNNAADVATVSPSIAWAGQGAKSIVQSYDSEFAKSVTQNISLIAASNDWGSNNTVPWGSFSGHFWTYYLPDCYLMPQYSPYITAVGGTELSLSSTGQYQSEIGWNMSGGGPSNLFPQPAWQVGNGVPQNGYRNIPDISLDASEQTPLTFFWKGSLRTFAGTSAGAPTFAGIVADIIQAAGHRVGFLNPTLYSIASSDPSTFHDITQGFSLVETASGPQMGYCASPGWDFVTGIGSPDSVKLAEHLTGLAFYDVAVTDVAAFNTVVGLGFSTRVNVTVANFGEYAENLNITLNANSTSINDTTVFLTSRSGETLTFTWNTTGFAYGNYTLEAVADRVLGEINTENNNCTGVCVTVTIPGDVDGNFKVGLHDLVILAQHYGHSPPDGHAEGTPECEACFNADIDDNGVVGLHDLVLLAQNYGQHYP